MNLSRLPYRSWVSLVGLLLAALGLATIGAACSGEGPNTSSAAAQAQATTESVATAPVTQEPTKTPLRLLKTQPEQGYAGDAFTMTGNGLPPNKEVEFVWVTVDGGFDVRVKPDNVEFYEAVFEDKTVALGRATVNAQGEVRADFTAPEDFGGIHDIYIVSDGQQIAKGGYRVLRQVTMEPSEGPVGTPITMKITGLGWKEVEAKMAVRYDSQFTGFVSAITTRGTATAVLRAAGPVGMHAIEMSGTGVNGGGYLNNQQSPYAHIYPENGSFRSWFRVTEDAGLPPDTFEWPDPSRVIHLGANDPTTTDDGESSNLPGTLTLDRSSGPIATTVNVRGSDLPANTEFDLVWAGIMADKLGTPGWDRVPQKNLQQGSVGKFSSDQAGNLTASFEVPDELGGWHEVRLVKEDGTIVAKNKFLVDRSLVSVSARRVKAGDNLVIEAKGIGWTDLDNGFAVTYDNAFFGYACGFNSGGTIILNIPVTGTPGTHLIDLYPMTHLRSTGKKGWVYSMPQLTFRQDHPGLAVGYNVPAIRLAIEIVE